MKATATWYITASCLLWLSGCAVRATFVAPDWSQADPLADDRVEASLILVGDAGEPYLTGPEPVFDALRSEASRHADRTLVVFLGDNVYPDGLPEVGVASRARAEAILRAQVEAVARAGAQGVFIPGNHDHKSAGRAGIVRQAAYIASLGHPGIQALPANGCLGPASIDHGSRLRLLFLDTTLWLGERSETLSDCPFRKTGAAAAAISELLATDRTCIVLGHHPLATHGRHGGFFTWEDHLFPLRAAHSALWIPLPVLGTFYTWYRSWGAYGQDIGSGSYHDMIEQLLAAFASHPPLLYAAGHDHNLQILRGERGVPYLAVSGAGTAKRREPVGRERDTLFVSPHAGFMRLDVLSDGKFRLEIVEVLDDGTIRSPRAAMLLQTGPEPRP